LLPFSYWLSAHLNNKRVRRGEHSHAPAITPIFIYRVYHIASSDATSSRLGILAVEKPRVVKRPKREVSIGKPSGIYTCNKVIVYDVATVAN